MTLIQGAGVHWPSSRIVTYSRPPSAKPPRPLKNSSSRRGETGDATLFFERASRGSRVSWPHLLEPFHLFEEVAAAAEEHRAGDALEQRPGRGRHLFAPENEHGARAAVAPWTAAATAMPASPPPGPPADPARTTAGAR